MKILVINGPNLNMLGARDSEKYGSSTLSDLESKLKEESKNIQFTFFQSNIEGEIVTEIQKTASNFDCIIINPGGYAHTSVAIRDALEICNCIKIEVHLSHLAKRENFRHVLITSTACDGYISGFKEDSYSAAVFLAQKLFSKRS